MLRSSPCELAPDETGETDGGYDETGAASALRATGGVLVGRLAQRARRSTSSSSPAAPATVVATAPRVVAVVFVVVVIVVVVAVAMAIFFLYTLFFGEEFGNGLSAAHASSADSLSAASSNSLRIGGDRTEAFVASSARGAALALSSFRSRASGGGSRHI